MYCTTELYLSVDNRKKTTNKEGAMSVYNVVSVVIISQLLSFVPFAVPTFVPPSAISRYLVKCSDVSCKPLSRILPISIVNRVTSA